MARYGLPDNVVYCQRCVMSNQTAVPSVVTRDSKEGSKQTIIFDDGICQPCHMHESFEKTIDWEQREKELVELLDRYRSSDGSYDCIVPGSGGKDSVFQSVLLKEKYGMNPLTVTWAPHMYTDIGHKNFENWIHKGGFDNFLFTPSGEVHRKLTQLAYRNLLHPFQPFIFGQRNYVVHMAKLLGIKLVFFGENPAQYGGVEGEEFSPIADSRYFTEDDQDSMLVSGLTLKLLETDHGITRNDLQYYLPLTTSQFDSLNLDIRWLGHYIKFHPQYNFYYAQEKTAFQANDQRTEGTYSRYNSIDDKLDCLHYWTGFIKFGMGRASHEASQEVRNGDLTREEAVSLVRKYDGELPLRYLPEILEYLNMSKEEFLSIADSFRSPHLWEKSSDGAWILRHQVDNLLENPSKSLVA